MIPSEIKKKQILISPLNWGMGHVARCIPLINLFLKNENTVFVACNSEQKQIFIQYFPELKFIFHEGYPFKFGRNGNFALDLAKQFFPLSNRMNKENKEVDYLVSLHNIDIVVSDHRYGFRSDSAYSILLCHQLNLPTRRFEEFIQKMHFRFLKLFNEIWVPDTLNSDYAGELSLNKREFVAEYIGGLSRFSLYDDEPNKTFDQVIIISGPAIYAKKFLEDQLLSLKENENSSAIIAPKEILSNVSSNNFILKSSEDWIVCDQIILQSKKIISRCGYSTLMDLNQLKTPFSVTPTPGQREQEYLFDLWNKKSFSDKTSSI
jgi:hypothetical protein